VVSLLTRQRPDVADEKLIDVRESFACGEPLARIDDCHAPPEYAGKRRERHRHMCRAEDHQSYRGRVDFEEELGPSAVGIDVGGPRNAGPDETLRCGASR